MKQRYRQGIFFEKHEKPAVLALECASTDGSARYKIVGDAIRLKEENRIVRVFGKEISVKPNKEVGGDTYMISTTVTFDAPAEYSDVIAFAGATSDLTVEATVPDDCGFDVADSEMSTAGQWLVKRFFMAGEHVRVRWWPKSGSIA